MKWHDAHAGRIYRRDATQTEHACLLGVAWGRVRYDPHAEWLYSVRLFLLAWRVEVLWTTGEAYRSGELA